eukprot:5679180-Pyramimonas_sp.AAC.1
MEGARADSRPVAELQLSSAWLERAHTSDVVVAGPGGCHRSRLISSPNGLLVYDVDRTGMPRTHWPYSKCDTTSD